MYQFMYELQTVLSNMSNLFENNIKVESFVGTFFVLCPKYRFMFNHRIETNEET